MESEAEYRSSGLGERLRLAREWRGLTQAELSERAGVERKSFYNIENDKMQGNVKLPTLVKLARALNLPPGWLAFGPDDNAARLGGLSDELEAVKKDQIRLEEALERRRCEDLERDSDLDDDGERDDDDGEEDDQVEPDDQVVALACPTQVKPLDWPLGFRPTPLGYAELPPLGQHYAPILEALGPTLPHWRRVEVEHVLLSLLGTDELERDIQKEKTEMLRKLLLSTVPKQDHAIIDLVIHDLNSPDPVVRGMMALSLIVDGGIPVSWRSLNEIRPSLPYGARKLRRAMDLACKIMRTLVYARLERQRALPAAPQNAPLLDG